MDEKEKYESIKKILEIERKEWERIFDNYHKRIKELTTTIEIIAKKINCYEENRGNWNMLKPIKENPILKKLEEIKND